MKQQMNVLRLYCVNRFGTFIISSHTQLLDDFRRTEDILKKITALCVALLIPIFAQANDFGSMEIIGLSMKHNGNNPDQFAPYVQDVDTIETDGNIRVHFIDAVFVDWYVAAAWTVENIGNDQLYVTDTKSVGGMLPDGFWYESTTGILQPGDIRYCGYAGNLENWKIQSLFDAEQHFIVNVVGLSLLGEPRNWNDIANATLTEADVFTRDAEINRLFDEEGIVVIGENGNLYAGQGEASFYYDSNSSMPSAAQMYLQSGKVEENSHVCLDVALEMDVANIAMMH